MGGQEPVAAGGATSQTSAGEPPWRFYFTRHPLPDTPIPTLEEETR